MGEDGRPRHDSRALALVRHVGRWQPRSYLKIWALAVAGYLVCAIVFTAVLGRPQARGTEFVSAAIIWFGVGAGQSFSLRRRRTG